MTVLPVFSYYLTRWWLRKLQLISPTTCHFPAVHTHKLPSSTCYSFHFLLLFLSFLLHNVFSQVSSDDNCTITSGAVHPGIPRVSRIGCTTQSCLSCNQAKAECFHNTTSNTFTCVTNTSGCSVEICALCQYCIPTISSPTTSPNFLLHSLFYLPAHIARCMPRGQKLVSSVF